MPAPASSLLHADYLVVRLRVSTYFRGRRLALHGPHGTLRALPIADALRLIDNGQAKVPGGVTRRELVDHINALELA